MENRNQVIKTIVKSTKHSVRKLEENVIKPVRTGSMSRPEISVTPRSAEPAVYRHREEIFGKQNYTSTVCLQ